MSPPKRLPPEARRDMLLDAGQALFGAKPYDAVSLADISARAGVSRPLIQHYFGNKRSLYRAVFARALDALSERVHNNPAPIEPNAVRATMLDYFQFATSHPAGALVAGNRGGDEVVSEQIAAFIERTTDRLLARIPIRKPHLRPALDTWSQMNIALTQRIIREGDIDCEWAAAFSTTMLMAAIAAA